MTSFNKIINASPTVLIDFHATWCGPCKTLAPILKELKEKQGEALKVIKIDIDKNNRLASTLNVKSVPTLMLYKNGKMVWRQSGVVPLNVIEAQL